MKQYCLFSFFLLLAMLPVFGHAQEELLLFGNNKPTDTIYLAEQNMDATIRLINPSNYLIKVSISAEPAQFSKLLPNTTQFNISNHSRKSFKLNLANADLLAGQLCVFKFETQAANYPKVGIPIQLYIVPPNYKPSTSEHEILEPPTKVSSKLANSSNSTKHKTDYLLYVVVALGTLASILLLRHIFYQQPDFKAQTAQLETARMEAKQQMVRFEEKLMEERIKNGAALDAMATDLNKSIKVLEAKIEQLQVECYLLRKKMDDFG